jgi:hypothetical protein
MIISVFVVRPVLSASICSLVRPIPRYTEGPQQTTLKLDRDPLARLSLRPMQFSFSTSHITCMIFQSLLRHRIN